MPATSRLCVLFPSLRGRARWLLLASRIVNTREMILRYFTRIAFLTLLLYEIHERRLWWSPPRLVSAFHYETKLISVARLFHRFERRDGDIIQDTWRKNPNPIA